MTWLLLWTGFYWIINKKFKFIDAQIIENHTFLNKFCIFRITFTRFNIVDNFCTNFSTIINDRKVLIGDFVNFYNVFFLTQESRKNTNINECKEKNCYTTNDCTPNDFKRSSEFVQKSSLWNFPTPPKKNKTLLMRRFYCWNWHMILMKHNPLWPIYFCTQVRGLRFFYGPILSFSYAVQFWNLK